MPGEERKFKRRRMVAFTPVCRRERDAADSHTVIAGASAIGVEVGSAIGVSVGDGRGVSVGGAMVVSGGEERGVSVRAAVFVAANVGRGVAVGSGAFVVVGDEIEGEVTVSEIAVGETETVVG
jgi:hypothetical protein